MSKIEEMASSTYFLQQHSGWLTNEELEDVEHGIKVRKEAFIKGANAVLKEIETRIAMGRHASMQTAEMILDSVEMTIKELKGE